MHILVLESSTTSAKAMLYDTATHTSIVETQEYTNNPSDITTHDANNVFTQLMAVGKSVIQNTHVDMIALSSTWHSLLVCDQQMKPCTPVYLWSYSGASEVCKQLRKDNAFVKSFYQKTGCMVHASYPVFKAKFLSEQGFDLTNKIICGQGEYNNYRLTNQRRTTICMASGTGFIDVHHKQYDDTLLDFVSLKKDQLFEIDIENKTYPLSEEGATLLGIPQGTPVVLSNADGGMNQVGAMAIEEGIMTLSIGTSGALRLTTKQPQLKDVTGTWCYVSPMGYLNGAAISGACNCVDWVKKQFFDENMTYGDIEEGMEHKFDNPIFLPFLFGERCPGWIDDRKGGFYEVTSEHTKYDFYQSVQEGVLFNLYHCYNLLKDVNETIHHIRLSGGILHSKKWTQMCADIFQMPLEVDNNEQESLLGGVILASQIAGLDIKELFEFKPKEIIYPRTNMAKRYVEKYERYLSCYNREK